MSITDTASITIVPGITTRVVAVCPRCDRSTVISIARLAHLKTADVEARLVCWRCGVAGAILSPAPRIEVED